MADLITLEYATTMLPGLSAAKLAALPTAISAASEAIEAHCRRAFAQAPAVELYDGDGTSSLILDRFPVASIASIRTGADTDDPTTLDPSEYAFKPSTGEVRLRCRNFPEGFANVEITNTAGPATVPGPVQQAAVQVAKALVDQALRDTTVDSERWEDYSWSRQQMREDFALPATAKQLLAPYINHRA